MACKIFLLVLAFFCLSFSFSEANYQMVPAMFLFGDSLLDVGNNIHLALSAARADYSPYGVDFPNKEATGRFSNGKNAADFIAEKMGLPTSPPYLSLRNKNNKASLFMKGVSFASAGAGILNSTMLYGPQLGQLISLTKQVDQYEIVHQELVKELGSSAAQEQEQYFSKSIFNLVIGTTDFANYDLLPDLQIKYTKEQYASLMSSSLKRQLKRLYSFGARKFLVAGLGQIGCMPVRRVMTLHEDCDEELNFWAQKYNEKLKIMLHELKLELQGFFYSYVETYKVMQNIIQNPTTYGFTEVKASCCGFGRLNAMTNCFPASSYCSNRKEYFFWDSFHPSEAIARIFIDSAFNDTSPYTFPVSVRQLIDV